MALPVAGSLASIRQVLGRRSQRRTRPWTRWRPLVESLERRELLAVAAAGMSDDWSVARMWNEQLLDAIRIDTPRPTVHARNLFHTSAAMYDAWAAFDPVAATYLNPESIPLDGVSDVDAAEREAVSYAAYRVLSERFAHSPGAATSLASFDALMTQLGYDTGVTTTTGNQPAAVGNRVAARILAMGATDGSNEANGYADTTGYMPANGPGIVTQTGTQLIDPNRWQPLVVDGNTQSFLTPHWGDVSTFALSKSGPDEVHLDPGQPPLLGGVGDAEFKDAIVRVLQFSSRLDPAQGQSIDISPASLGDNDLGTNNGGGHAVNPFTGLPYEPNVVNLADYGRVLAEFWADGPKSETPPGHWNTIANTVSDKMDDLGLPKQIAGTGDVLGELEWDVKLYFTLNGAVHDSAVAAWDAKEAYDYVRPITMARYMGGLGQSSDPGGPSYHPDGLPLVPGLIEVITADSIADGKHAHLADHLGEVAIFAWQGHPDDPSGVGGVDWILAGDWLPYQAANFVTPPFAGYISGHSTFSRASAEVLTMFTGSPYFPGGLGEFHAPANDFLKFEGGPTTDVTLQWATYYDASDEAGVSRLHGGIHVDADDFAGRIVGSQAGVAAFQQASHFFTADGIAQDDLQVVHAGTTVVRRNGADLEVVDQAGNLLASHELSHVRSLGIGGSSGNDTLVVDFAFGGSFAFAGGISFHAGGGRLDTVRFVGSDESETMDIQPSSLRLDTLSVSLEGVEQFELLAGEGDNSFRAADNSLAGKLTLSSGGGDDTFRLVPAAARMILMDTGGHDTLNFSESEHRIRLNLGWQFLQYVGGGRSFVQLLGTFEDVVGSSGNDFLQGNSAANVLWGGPGNDLLLGGGGDDILLGGPGNDVLFGQAGNDVLSGNDGNDVLLDESGGNVLIGGGGRDLLRGGRDGDLLIGGSTLYDQQTVALRAIRDEWTQPTPLAVRIDHLQQGGGLNGTVVLRRDETLFGDGIRDLLFGGRGQDWFLDDPEDRMFL